VPACEGVRHALEKLGLLLEVVPGKVRLACRDADDDEGAALEDIGAVVVLALDPAAVVPAFPGAHPRVRRDVRTAAIKKHGPQLRDLVAHAGRLF
jgi:hypothetical protein